MIGSSEFTSLSLLPHVHMFLPSKASWLSSQWLDWFSDIARMMLSLFLLEC